MTTPAAQHAPAGKPAEDAIAVVGGSTNENPPGMSLKELLAEDYRSHGSSWTSPGMRAVWVHRFGNWRMSVSSRPLRIPLSILYRAMARRILRTYGIELDYSTKLGRRVVIDHQSGIVINGYCEIGDDCRLRQNVTMGVRRADDLSCPKLGTNVDVGAGAVLLGGITVGDNAVIGANAVVVTDVPPGCYALGVPAVIKQPKNA